MIRKLAAAFVFGLAACAHGQTPPDSASGERHFPRNEKIIPLEPLPDPSGLSAGALAYGVRCKGCHEPATPGAPDRLALARLPPEAIVASLATGKMKIIAPDMPEQEMLEVAAFLTGKLPEARP